MEAEDKLDNLYTQHSFSETKILECNTAKTLRLAFIYIQNFIKYNTSNHFFGILRQVRKIP